MASELIKYDAMCTAIIACESVDEVKEIRNQAKALEAYFKLSKNHDNERRAIKIRLRTERRGGQILRLKEKAKRGSDKQPNKNGKSQRSQRSTSETKTLKQMGRTKDDRCIKTSKGWSDHGLAVYALRDNKKSNGDFNVSA